MRRILKWLVLGFLGLIVLSVMVSALSGGGARATPTPGIAAATFVYIPTSVIITPTPAPALPTATPTPAVGTRQNPVPFGADYTFKHNDRTYTVRVLEAILNASAQVKEANMFNDTPPDGHDYILVRLRLTYTAGSQDRPFATEDGEHRLYAGNRFWGAPRLSIAPDPEFDGQDIFPGATVEGWLPGKYLPRALADQAVLVYNNVYFALR